MIFNFYKTMPKPCVFLFMICFGLVANAQKIEVESGSIKALTNITRYQVLFEYGPGLQVKGFRSEEEFINTRTEKFEMANAGSGQEFKKLWYENRINLYEPSFVQQFNGFYIENGQVTVARKINEADCTMLIKTEGIASGYDDLFYVKEGSIDVTVVFYKNGSPQEPLYTIRTKVRGDASAEEFERMRTAYANLGLALSKHLSRKARLKK